MSLPNLNAVGISGRRSESLPGEISLTKGNSFVPSGVLGNSIEEVFVSSPTMSLLGPNTTAARREGYESGGHILLEEQEESSPRTEAQKESEQERKRELMSREARAFHLSPVETYFESEKRRTDLRVRYNSMHKFDTEVLKEFKHDQKNKALNMMKRLKYRFVGKFGL